MDHGPAFHEEGADRSRRPSRHAALGAYIFFAVHVLVAAFHMPPAFAHSAAVLVFVTSPAANVGPVKASATATARTETRVFMAFSPLRGTKAPAHELETPSWQPLFLKRETPVGYLRTGVLNNPAKLSCFAHSSLIDLRQQFEVVSLCPVP